MTNPITDFRSGIVTAVKEHEQTAGIFKRFYLFDQKIEYEIEPGPQELPAVLIEHDAGEGVSVLSSGTYDLSVSILIRIWTPFHSLPDAEELVVKVLRATRLNRTLAALGRFQNASVSISRGRLKASGEQNLGFPVTESRITIPAVIKVC